ncbi:hypothetical protein BC332_23103 [Capsicum chinense]|nr:hypothetical protein BC332_23103 [Capsicum chinense]
MLCMEGHGLSSKVFSQFNVGNQVSPYPIKLDNHSFSDLSSPILLLTEFYNQIILEKIDSKLGTLMKIDTCMLVTLRGRYVSICIQIPLTWNVDKEKDKPYSPEHEKPNLGPGHAIGLSSRECTPNVISRLQCPDNPSLSQPFILRHSTLHTPPGEPIIHTMGNTRSPFLSNEHNFWRKPRMGRKHSIGLTNLMQQGTGENVRKLCGTKEPEEMLTITEEQEGKNSLSSETGSPGTHEILNQLKEKKENRTTLIQSIPHDELHNLEC